MRALFTCHNTPKSPKTMSKTPELKPYADNTKNTEYLSEDIFEEDFLKVFSNLHKAQWILGFNRVDARDLFISPLTRKQKILTIVRIVIELTSFGLVSYFTSNIFYNYDDLNYMAVHIPCMTAFTFLISVINARFKNNKRNVKFLLKMQEIDRLMGIARIKPINGLLRRCIHFNMAVAGAVGLIFLVFSLYGGFWMMVGFGTISWCMAGNILETTHCSNLLVYFVLRVRLISSVMLNQLEGMPQGKLPRLLTRPSLTALRLLVSQTHDFRVTETDVHLKMLFDCFTELQELYKFPIAVHFSAYFLNFWYTVQYAISGLKHNFSLTQWALPPIIIFFGVLQSLALTYRFEMFFREVQRTKRLAIAVMARYQEGPVREKARRMHRLVSRCSPRFSVYDVWSQDAVFLVRFYNAVTTMIVTELQFGLR